MKRIINLLSFDLKSSMFDIEQIQKETGADIRYLGIPYRDNDATMYHFFQQAYPSQFQHIEFSDMEKYLKSDAVFPKNYYTKATGPFLSECILYYPYYPKFNL